MTALYASQQEQLPDHAFMHGTNFARSPWPV